MQSIGRQRIRTLIQTIVGGEHDPQQDRTNQRTLTVYRRADGQHFINDMGGKVAVTEADDGAFEFTRQIRSMGARALPQATAGLPAARPAPIATGNPPQLKTVLEFDSGDRWIEFDSDEAAEHCGVLLQTGMGFTYLHEGRLEGGHPRRWFALVGLDDAGLPTAKVGLCVLPDGVACRSRNLIGDCYITGHRNFNPYPEFTTEIDSLSEATGLSITPNYMGNTLDIKPQTPASGRRM